MNSERKKLDEISSSITRRLAEEAEKKRSCHNKMVSDLVGYYDGVLGKYPSNFTVGSDLDERAKNYWGRLLPDRSVSDAALYYGRASGIDDVRFVHDGIFYGICNKYFNNEEFALKFDNKAYYPILFHDIVQPVSIAFRINDFWLDGEYRSTSFEQVLENCRREDSVVLKYAKGSCGGRGVCFFDRSEISSKMKDLLLSSKNDMVIQTAQTQCRELCAIHPDSLNTIRIMTLLTADGAVVLSSVLRMGRDGSRVDNASAGGIVCGIDPDGRTKEFAFDNCAVCYRRHPSGSGFSDIVIPGYRKCADSSTVLQERFPYCRMISWDWAISENGTPVLIEANFSDGELDFHQLCNGPIFGDLTAAVIRECTGGGRVGSSLDPAAQNGTSPYGVYHDQ